MMHYRKGENVEAEFKKDDLPFEDCMSRGQKDFLWMHVKGGTKVNNVVSHVKNAIDTGACRSLVWSGSGGGVVKTISCAEILKRGYPLYQVTRMCYTTITEHWTPQMEGLEKIVAKREIPSLHILMSLDAIDDSIHGLQKPNASTEFWIYDKSSNKGTSKTSKNQIAFSNNFQTRNSNHRPRLQNTVAHRQEAKDAPKVYRKT